MSVDILFDQQALWVPGPGDIPFFYVVEEWGCTSTYDHQGNIARHWTTRFFGTFQDALANAARYPSDWSGGQAQRGTKHTNAKRPWSAAAYIDSVENAMRQAMRTSGLFVEIDLRYSDKPEAEKLTTVFKKTLEDHGLDPNLTRLTLNTDHAVYAAQDLFRWARDERIGAWRFFPAANRHANHEAIPAPVGQIEKRPCELPTVCKLPDRHVLVTTSGKTRFCSDYAAVNDVKELAINVARSGGSPANVYRRFDRALKTAPDFAGELEFELSEQDVRSWRPMIDIGAKPGLVRVNSQTIKPYVWAEALNQGNFRIINAPSTGASF